MGRIAGRFGRMEPRRTARAYVTGLLSGIERVLAVAGNRRVGSNGAWVPVADTTGATAPRLWHHYGSGPGAKGPRHHDWAWTPIDPHTDGHRWPLIRRNPKTGELAYYRCDGPHPVPLLTLVRTAGIRWSIEEAFPTGKGQVGLDHYQVRTWTGWHRHITLAMLALAFLATTSPPATPQQIALTMPEIRRLLAVPAGAFGRAGRPRRWVRPHRPQGCVEPLGGDIQITSLRVRGTSLLIRIPTHSETNGREGAQASVNRTSFWMISRPDIP